MIYSLYIIVIISLCVAILLYLRSRKYERLYSNILSSRTKTQTPIKNIKNSSSEIGVHTELSSIDYKVDMIVKSDKVTFWDYDVKNNMFIYSTDQHNKTYNHFSWDKYIEYVHPDDRKISQEAMQSLINNDQQMLQDSYRIKIPGNEEYRWFDLIGVVSSLDESGAPILISGARWDITSSICEKQELQDAKTLLELSFDASGIIPWEEDLKTGIWTSNNENSFLYGNFYTAEEYANMYVHPDYIKLFLEANNKLRNREDNVIDIKIQQKYAEEYEWVHIIGKTIDNKQTGSFKAVGTSAVITHIIESQNDLIRLRNQADKSNNLKSAFLANMSHEIRTPLNAIVGFSNLIVEMTENKENVEIKKYVQIIEMNNNLLLQLVGDILDISKIEAGQMEFHFNELDICSVINEQKMTYFHKLPQGVELICELPDTSYVINTDKNRLIQVISNLLSNAIKYTTAGSITIGCTHLDKDHLRLYVRDTGKGISDENIPKLFNRFAKFDSQVPGTGLGLSICETIVERLGGEIGAVSKLGKGSEFWFTIRNSKQ